MRKGVWKNHRMTQNHTESHRMTQNYFGISNFQYSVVFNKNLPQNFLHSVVFTNNGPINLLSDRLLRYVLIFEYQILVLDLVVDIRTKISEGI